MRAVRSSSIERAKRGEVVVRPALGREPREHGLEVEAGLEALENAVEPEVRDEEAAIHLELDEPVAGEPPQRLADGAARDPERVGELGLPDPRAGARRPSTIIARSSS